MSREGNFLVYCTEQYKFAKGLTGIQVSELFSKYRVWDYIYSCFEALHTTGEIILLKILTCILRQGRQQSYKFKRIIQEPFSPKQLKGV